MIGKLQARYARTGMNLEITLRDFSTQLVGGSREWHKDKAILGCFTAPKGLKNLAQGLPWVLG